MMSDVQAQILFDMSRRLTPNQKLIMIALRLSDGGLDRYDLQEAIGVGVANRRVLQRCLKYLEHAGLVVRSGERHRLTFFNLGPNA